MRRKAEEDRLEYRFRQLADADFFSEDQKKVIYRSMEDGLNDNEIRVLLNNLLSAEQMKICEYGFLCGLTVDDVKKYAMQSYSVDEMNHIRFSLMNPNERRLVDYLIDKGFDQDQMIEIRLGSDLPLYCIDLYAQPCYSSEQMRQLRLGAHHGLSYKQLCYYCDARFTPEQMRIIRGGFESGISCEKALEYAQPDVPEESMYKAVQREKRNMRARIRTTKELDFI